ncbi:hypothetical protein FOZ63_016588, partial [Perkinsus olseni]
IPEKSALAEASVVSTLTAAAGAVDLVLIPWERTAKVPTKAMALRIIMVNRRASFSGAKQLQLKANTLWGLTNTGDYTMVSHDHTWTAPAVDLHEQDHSGTSDLPSGRGNQGWRDLFDNRVHGKSMPKAQISEHKVSNGLPERNRPGRALD